MSSRLEKIQQILKDEKLDALLVSSLSHIAYLTGYDHFTPLEREAFLIVTRSKNSGQAKKYIITDGRYSESVIEKIPHFQLLEISSTNRIENILKKLSKSIKVLGFEPYNLTVSEYKLFKKCFSKLSPISLSSIRDVKDADEIKKIEKACRLGDRAFAHALTKIKPGVTEKQIAFEIEMFVKSHGADLSFPSIVAFGKNSSIPHHATGNTKLKRGDFVLIDMGTKVESYCSDMTRTLVFGKATAEQKKMYETVMEAQSKAIEALYNKLVYYTVEAKKIDEITRTHIEFSGYPTIPHSLGHGIGLEVHESPSLSPRSKDKIEKDMVFSIEPGIYVPGFGGVRIEDLIYLTKTGPQILTKAPREFIEL